jgi:GntR family transcriptional regulator/MocR family aminotransferase
VFLKQGVQDVQLAELWNSFNLQVFPLSSWYSQKNKRYGLVIGYTNIQSEQEAIAALSLAYKATMALLKLGAE